MCRRRRIAQNSAKKPCLTRRWMHPWIFAPINVIEGEQTRNFSLEIVEAAINSGLLDKTAIQREERETARVSLQSGYGFIRACIKCSVENFNGGVLPTVENAKEKERGRERVRRRYRGDRARFGWKPNLSTINTFDYRDVVWLTG